MHVRGYLKKSMGQWIRTPEHYASALSWGATLLRSGRVWSTERLLSRLSDLERFAFWEFDAWKSDPTVKQRRETLLRGMADLLAAHRERPASWDDRRRINHLLCRVEFALQEPHVRGYPWRANIELTSQCNLRCPMCPQTLATFERNYTDDRILDHIRSAFPWLELVDVTGFGEPLLSPLVPRILANLGEHSYTRMITNGILLDEKIARTMVEHRLRELSISLDAATPETYRIQRKSEQFEKILANVRRLVEIRAASGAGLPLLSFNLAFMQSNGHELPELIRMARRMGVERVCTGYLSVCTTDMREQSFYFDKERGNALLADAQRVAAEEGIELHAPEKFAMRPPNEFPAAKDCADPWEFVMIKSTAEVGTCCMTAEAFGGLHDTDILELWQSEKYADFRRRVNSPEAPNLCKSCAFGRETCVDDPSMHFYDEQFVKEVADSGQTLLARR